MWRKVQFLREAGFSLIIAAFIIVSATGCTTQKKAISSPSYSAPSVSKVIAPLKSARAVSVQLRDVVATQSIDKTREDLAQIAANILAAETFSADLEREINKQTEILNKTVIEKNQAVEQVNYWQEKQQKALAELWKWRLAALAIVGIIGGVIAVKLGVFGAKLL